jgi:hypothetical protein
VFNISKALTEPLPIPLTRQKVPDKRPAIAAAAIAVFFALNAMAAKDASPTGDSPAAGPDAKSAERNRIQEETRKEMLDHWKKMSPKEREQVRNKMKDHSLNMSPEEREARRKEMREHFKNMSPEERRQFQRDMGKADSAFQAADDLRKDNTSTSNKDRQ